MDNHAGLPQCSSVSLCFSPLLSLPLSPPLPLSPSFRLLIYSLASERQESTEEGWISLKRTKTFLAASCGPR